MLDVDKGNSMKVQNGCAIAHHLSVYVQALCKALGLITVVAKAKVSFSKRMCLLPVTTVARVV